MIALSDEQLNFIDVAMRGENILVDACIGSGKTTAIQRLCDELPHDKKILYLTYNKLLKIDARNKIKKRNVTVTNYHGFAYSMLKKRNIAAGIPDLIQTFLKVKPPVPRYDVLVLDEYQDIEQEFAEMLEYVKACSPNMQIIAVGDMEQKIYDKTTLDVRRFIREFLGDCRRLNFTKCFRLCPNHAAMLGRVWQKSIIGVNEKCIVSDMDREQAVAFLSSQKPKDILCLGSRTGDMSYVLNRLEEEYPADFNKSTVYASIQDDDGNRAVDPDGSCAIFTTYDSSKGLERKICAVFDFTENYWGSRISKPQQSYEILRNIFCVAASRGKERIIFVSDGEQKLSESTLSQRPQTNDNFGAMDISSMFDFKFIEDVERCYSLLELTPLKSADSGIINIKNRDGLIDLSPCIGTFQEAAYFDDFDIDKEIDLFFALHRDLIYLQTAKLARLSLEKKILFLTSLETKQERYRLQVKTPFVERGERRALMRRLKERLRKDEIVQKSCSIAFLSPSGGVAFVAKGLADAVKDDTVYELKFVSELTHVHFLQCATYMVALGLPKGVLWNTRDNAAVQIKIPDKKSFLDAVARAATKGALERYYAPDDYAPEGT